MYSIDRSFFLFFLFYGFVAGVFFFETGKRNGLYDAGFEAAAFTVAPLVFSKRLREAF